MKTKSRRIVLIALAAVIIVAVFAIFRTVSGHTRQIPLDTSGALVSLTQNGDTIVFNPDGTYIIQGDVEIQGVTFTYETQGSYSVLDGKLVFNESAPLISVNSKFGSFDLSGDIHTEIIDGALIVQLEASNESNTFELAYFTLGKEEADHLGVVGVTAGSWEDDPNAENTENKEEETPVKDPPKLDAEGALLTIESAGNKIAFFPDNTFRLLAQFSQSDGGLNLTFDYSLEDRYEVKDDKLILPKETTGLLNSDFMASYGYTDVETPTKCSAEIVDGLLELHFVIQVDGGEKEVAVFKIGKEDAEKLGITGVEGATVVEEKKDPPAPTSSYNAPAQPSVASDAKPLSFSSGEYTITFYSNGQYKESGTVYAGGATVSVTVTDTYTIDENGTLSIRSGNQVSCYASMGGYDVSFGAPNNTACSGNSGGYTISFHVPANGQTYHVGTVTLSADDVKRIQENFGLEGEKPEPTPEPTPEPSPSPDDPSAEIIQLNSEAGITLTFYPDSNTFDVTGKTVLGGMELASYSLTAPGTYSTVDNTLTLNPATLKITALHDMAKPLEGETEISFSVEKSDDNTLQIILPIGDPPVSYSMTSDQAKKIGIDLDTYSESSDVPSDPYTPDDSKTVITFIKDYGAFTISGAGKFVVSGMDADLTFTAADTYSVADDGTVTAANTADALAYTVTMFGQSSEAKTTPTTVLVKDGDNYKVTLIANVNGQTITLCEGTVKAEDVITEETPASPYTPDDSKTVITFMKDYGAFTISGAGKFSVSGMEADLTFTAADTYSMADDGTVTAANTADALSYTVTMFGQSSEAKTTPTTVLVKDGDNYKVTLTADVNGQTITLCEGAVRAEDVITEETPASPYTPDDSETVITFMKDYGAFTISGAGKFVVSGMEADLTFTAADTYSVAADGNVTAANTADALSYTVTMFGQSSEAKTTPATVIVKDGDSYKVTLIANVSGQTITLCEGAVRAEDVITEETPASPYTPDDSKTVITFMKDYGAFTISGAGKFSVSGMDADLTFTAADTYSVAADGTVTAANTADALAYTVTMFGQSSEAKTTPATVIVKDGDSYKVTLTADVNGQTITLCSGVVNSNDVIKAVEEAPTVNYSSTSQTIHFDKFSKSYTASGSGTMSAMGMDIPITFSLTDAYSVSTDETLSAANTSGSLAYTAMGAPGTADPVTTISKSGEAYHITIQALINGQSITLLDQNVSREDVIAEDTAQPLSLQSTLKHNAAVKDLDIVPSLRDDASKEELTDAPLAPSNDEATQDLEAPAGLENDEADPSLRDDVSEGELADSSLTRKDDGVIQDFEVPADSKSDEKESVETPTTQADPPVAGEPSPDHSATVPPQSSDTLADDVSSSTQIMPPVAPNTEAENNAPSSEGEA